MAEISTNTQESVNADADFGEQLRAAWQSVNLVFSTVFGVDSWRASNVLSQVLYAEAYRRHKMDIHARWLALRAIAAYQSDLAKYGADGQGAIDRCREMMLKIADKYPGHDPCSVSFYSSWNTALRCCFGIEDRLIRHGPDSLTMLSEAYEDVAVSHFSSRQQVLICRCVRERLQAIVMREQGLSDQADLNVQAADYALNKEIGRTETLAQAQRHVEQLFADVVSLAAQIERLDHKDFLRCIKPETGGYLYGLVRDYIKARYSKTLESAKTRLRKESVRYRWFGIIPND